MAEVKDIKPYPLSKKLTIKQRQWIVEYWNTMCLTEATMRSKYNVTSRASASQIGHENLLKLEKHIARYVEREAPEHKEGTKRELAIAVYNMAFDEKGAKNVRMKALTLLNNIIENQDNGKRWEAEFKRKENVEVDEQEGTTGFEVEVVSRGENR